MSPILGERLPYADPAGKPAEKVPLYVQISQAESELQTLKSELSGAPRMKPRRSETELKVKRQAAIVRTLRWFLANEHEVRAFVEARRTAQAASEAGE